MTVALGNSGNLYTVRGSPGISSLSEIAPWATAPLLPYDEAVEYVANEYGGIDFHRDGSVVVKVHGEEIHAKDLSRAVQVIETLNRYEGRLAELRHEIVEIETRRATLQETVSRELS